MPYKTLKQQRYIHAKKRSGELYKDSETGKWINIHNPAMANANHVYNGFKKEAARFIGKSLIRDLPSLKVRLRWLRKVIKDSIPKNFKELADAYR